MSEAEYQQEFECSFAAALRGAYYAPLLDIAEKEGRIALLPHAPDLPVHTAWDLGMDDATAIWFFQVEPSGNWRMLDYYEASGEGLAHYARILRQKSLPPDVKDEEGNSGRGFCYGPASGPAGHQGARAGHRPEPPGERGPPGHPFQPGPGPAPLPTALTPRDAPCPGFGLTRGNAQPVSRRCALTGDCGGRGRKASVQARCTTGLATLPTPCATRSRGTVRKSVAAAARAKARVRYDLFGT